jgi:DNA-cytosine methyltransferase
MKHASLFSGIGGFDLAAEWMGWENVFHCEINPFGQQVLKHYWPNSISYHDIKETDFTVWRGRIDILTGGWPCQDNSRANQINGNGQKGLQGERSQLWKQFERAIREIQPRYIVGENVSDVLTINQGRDFNEIMSGLAGMGYNAQWGVLRASDIGAAHHRARLYILAYTGSIGLQTLKSLWEDARNEIKYTKISGLFNGTDVSIGGAWQYSSGILRMDDGLPNRSHRFKALGNAIIPQVVLQIFKAIEQYDLLNNHNSDNPDRDLRDLQGN